MSVKFKKSYLNPYKFRQYTNSSKDLYDLQITNIMDSFFDSAMTNVTDGSFKAVVLSGIKTEDGDGTGAGANDARIVGRYMTVVVKPLTGFGEMLPDPRFYDNPEQINEIISMYKSSYTATSDHYFDATNPVSFGQVIDCYFEKGSIINSDFKTLRFSKPVGFDVDQSFESLASIIGVKLASETDWSMSSLLGDVLDTAASFLGFGNDHEAATKQGKCSNIKGTRTADKLKYIVLHYSAGFGGKQACLSYENRATDYGYHYMIDRDGSFFNSADPLSLIWHSAGNKQVGNRNSVGVCIMNVGYERPKIKAKDDWVTGKYPNNGSKTAKWEPFTNASFDSCAKICAGICKKFNIPVANIVGHSDIQTTKSDPGPAFDLLLFRNKVESLVTGKNSLELSMDRLNDLNSLPATPAPPPGLSTGNIPSTQAPAGISSE